MKLENVKTKGKVCNGAYLKARIKLIKLIA